MKNSVITPVVLMPAFILCAQSPQAFQYQTVVRDNTGQILVNQPVSLRNSIRKNSINSPWVYIESFRDTTNEFGLVTLEIGSGTVEAGNFENIDWGNGSFFLRIRIDPAGDTNYQLMGTTQLLSVPYALYSESTGDSTRWRKCSDDLYYNKGNVGIGTDSPDPGTKLDIRGNEPDDGGIINLGNSHNSHKPVLFSGRENNPNPFVQWKEEDQFRFATDEGELNFMVFI